MRKIPTLFQRDPDNRAHVTREVNSEAAWVIEGEGRATRKYDGTCVMLDEDGQWWARREVKPGKKPPPRWVQVAHDEVTGKSMGWEPVEQSAFAKLHAEVMHNALIDKDDLDPGTYELVGPKVNGNPERFDGHRLVPHGQFELDSPGRTYDELESWLQVHDYEGIVWHHPDGRMAKLKRRDFPSR